MSAAAEQVLERGTLRAEGLLPDGVYGHAPLDLSLEPGSLCCMVGRNFTGKTAWLRALAGLEQPAAGRLELMGADVWRMSIARWRQLRTKVAFITAEAPLLSWLDALSNVTLPAIYHELQDPDSARQRALDLLMELGYDGETEVLPAYLDEHHRRLLAMARSLMLEPRMMFIDEPFVLTDASAVKGLEDVLQGLARERGITVVVSTHLLGFAEAHADELLYADGTGLYVHGSWDALSQQAPDFVAGSVRVEETADG